MFIRRFYRPAVDVLGKHLQGFIFEQEYQTQKERSSAGEFCARLDDFFTQVPPDDRYHLEVRTESFLSPAYFDLLAKHGLGQVLSHWTWCLRFLDSLPWAGVDFLISRDNASSSC
ncbi:MAG: DUF72 domain-containing protein [Deltaproteobacteria bacterium]|nr:DUF72 domain-containing protein [Deltaproteobacteria bacterium]